MRTHHNAIYELINIRFKTIGSIMTVNHISVSHANISSYDPSLSEAHNPTATHQSIWRAVIVQALMDASTNSKKSENLQSKQDALIWLRGNSKDFLTVCDYAGFEPSFVRDMCKKALERGCQWRALPGTGEKARKHRALGLSKARATQSR